MKARIETKLTLTGIAVTATWVLMSALMGKSIVTDSDNQSDVDFEFVTGASYAISDCPEVITGYEAELIIPEEYLAKGIK